jgi:meso-butanediol dehydrogenase / (S,S)-butanediol dehydrogenase / diacetyl reductase
VGASKVVNILQGKIALVTGAGNGIGRGVAIRFACEGAMVGVLDICAESSKKVVEEIRATSGKAIDLSGDVSRSEDVSRCVQTLVRDFGIPGVLVHNAAVMPEGTIDETSEGDWDRVYATNVKGAYLTCREVIPLMRKAGSGSIILMASITGVNGFPALAAYSGTKGALISLARAMAIDHAAEGVRVNSVSPGTIDSPMLHAFVAAQSNPERTRRAFDEAQPRGRVGTIDEVVNVVTFLASDQASYISGSNVTVDGGMSIKGEQPRF